MGQEETGELGRLLCSLQKAVTLFLQKIHFFQEKPFAMEDLGCL